MKQEASRDKKQKPRLLLQKKKNEDINGRLEAFENRLKVMSEGKKNRKR